MFKIKDKRKYTIGRKYASAIIALCIVSTVFATTVLSDPPKPDHPIWGFVKDTEGHGINGVLVTVYNSRSGASQNGFSFWDEFSGNGSYSINCNESPDWQNGDQLVITGEKTGYQTTSVTLTYDTGLGSQKSSDIILPYGANMPPVISGPIPSNGATGVLTSLSSVSITITDHEGDLFNWTIQTSPNIGSTSGSGSTNGTKTCSIGGLVYGITYTWYVNATDTGSGLATYAVYTFVTESEYINYQPVISNPAPSNGATGVSISLSSLSVTITDPEGNPFSWSIETSPSVGSASGSGSANGTKTHSLGGLLYGTTYTWYVNATDTGSGLTTHAMYIFTTEVFSEDSEPPTITKRDGDPKIVTDVGGEPVYILTWNTSIYITVVDGPDREHATGVEGLNITFEIPGPSTTYYIIPQGAWIVNDDGIHGFYNISYVFTLNDYRTAAALESGELYHMYINATDEPGNSVEFKAQKFIIDDIPPIPEVTHTYQGVMPFNVTVAGNDSHAGVKSISLYFRYSTDNTSWGPWALYGTPHTLTTPEVNASHLFSFIYKLGIDYYEPGYYEFYGYVEDALGNNNSKPDGVVAHAYCHVLPLPADFNGDGRVNVNDIYYIINNWEKNEASPDWDTVKIYDLSNNGVIDAHDVYQLITKWTG